MAQTYDIIVVGGGPAGSSTTAFLAEKGYKVLLLDKATFPRDKTCGDGVGGKSVKILRELNLLDEIENNEHRKMYGVIFSSPKGEILDVANKIKDKKHAPGYTVRRYVLDDILFKNAKSKKTVKAYENYEVVDVLFENGKVSGIKAKDNKGNVKKFKANVIVGADGATSVIANKVHAEKIKPEHHVIAIRAYYKGITGMEDKIELHFIEDALPGYFWIFPMANGMANVGVGMLTSEIRKHNINLNEVMEKAINSEMMKPRFKDAKRISPIKGWGLPLGSKRRKGYGNGYVLVGDAAALIDPFSGEGIGNALLSGKLASIAIDKAFNQNDFSAEALSYYDELLKKYLDDELQTMYKLQKLGRFKFLINLMISKANRSKEIRDFISSTLTTEESMAYKKQLLNPIFWLKVLFA